MAVTLQQLENRIHLTDKELSLIDEMERMIDRELLPAARVSGRVPHSIHVQFPFLNQPMYANFLSCNEVQWEFIDRYKDFDLEFVVEAHFIAFNRRDL